MKAGLISDSCLARIRDATDIVSLVESYVSLKRSGKNWKGLCPFHDEKTPSFTVTPDKGRYRCFGCGESGSAFDFVIAIDRVDFREAAEVLAEKAGIELEYDESSGTAEAPRGPQKTDLHRVNKWAAAFFARELQKPAGKACRDYLAQRGIEPATCERFTVGYAPAGWSGLVDAAAKRNIPEDLLVEGGLAMRRERGEGLYDRFRDRLIFCIRDSMERVIAFGGRCLDGSEPKYLNSPETNVFSKRRSLYGIESLRRHRFGDPVFVMEGYTDVVMAAQVGSDSSVATLGTSLTEEHARLLTRYTDRIVLVYDGDAAGRKAAERGAELFAAVDASILISRLPSGEDPCDYLLKHGAAGLARMEEDAVDFFDFVLAEVRDRSDLASVSGLTRAADELMRMAFAIANPVKQGLVLDRIAAEFGIRRDDLLSRFSKKHAVRHRTASRAGANEPQAGAHDGEAADAEQPAIEVPPAQRRAEQDLLRALLHGGGAGIAWRERIGAQDVVLPAHRALFERLVALSDDQIDGDALGLSVQDGVERKLLNRLMATASEDREVLQAQLEGALGFFERRRGVHEIASLKRRGLDDQNLDEIVQRLRGSHGRREKS